MKHLNNNRKLLLYIYCEQSGLQPDGSVWKLESMKHPLWGSSSIAQNRPLEALIGWTNGTHPHAKFGQQDGG